MIPDWELRRAVALIAAAIAYQPHRHPTGYGHSDPRPTARHVTELATAFAPWLAESPPVASFTIRADTPTDRPDQERGGGMSLTFPDTQQVTLRVIAVVDAEGETVSDTFTWAVDNSDVLILTPAEDTMSCLAVPGTVAGSAIVSATASDGVARTFAIDVSTGPTADFQVVADAPVDRTPAAEPTA